MYCCRAVVGLAAGWNEICRVDWSAKSHLIIWTSCQRLHV